MKIPYPNSRMLGEPDLLPMINIVFLLLIFFMIAGVVTVDRRGDIQPPSSSADGALRARAVALTIAADGTLGFDEQPQSPESLAEAVSAHLETHANASIVLHADAQADASTLVEVMEVLRRTGVSRVRMLTSAPLDAVR